MVLLQENERLHCHGIGCISNWVYMILRASVNVLFFVKGKLQVLGISAFD